MTERLVDAPEHFGLSDWAWENIAPNPEAEDLVASRLSGLVERYSEEHRKYHTYDHALFMLDFFEAHQDLIQNPRVMIWAALYYDAVFDTGKGAVLNEQRSAQIARKELAALLTRKELALVTRYIQVTANHVAEANDSDLALFVDADLAILGSPLEVYDEYSQRISEEYRDMDPESYRAGRAALLENFLARKPIYLTEAVRREFEAQARRNLKREIRYLKAS